MYLMDSIAAVAAMVPAVKASDPIIAMYPLLTRRMSIAPRFLLDNSAIGAAVEITLGRPKILLEAMAHLRIPYSRMWVEWDEDGRERIRRKWNAEGLEVESEERPLPSRLGFLLEVEPGGRRGVVTWAWSSRKVEVPSIAPVSGYFDLDRTFPVPPERITGLLRGNLAKLWVDNPVQLDALFGIWRTAEHYPSDWGLRWLNAVTSTKDEFAYRLAHAYGDVYGEFIGVWAILMLLTASRKAVDLHEISRAKLNKARAKKREPLLLDHTQVVLHINNQTINAAGVRAPLNHTRKPPRIHMVSRYLARRGDKHWLVEPYLRGSGEPVQRHVHVRS